MINKLLVALIAVLFFGADTLSAQDSTGKVSEKDIKVTGNYYYGDGSSDDEQEAQEIAIEELKMMISESIRMENPDIDYINFSGFDNSIGTVSINLDNYVRVIAFVLKKEVSVKSSGLKTLMVIRLSPDGPAIEDSASQVATTDVKQEVETKPAVVEESKVEVAPVIEPEPTPVPVAVVEPEPTPAPEPTPTPVVTTTPTTTVTQTNNAIINEILKLTESKDVGVLLDKYKDAGKLVYGRLSTITNPEKCYFVVLRSGKLVDVLDQGTSTTRKGLISNGLVNYSKSYDIIYWVYIY